MPRTTSKPWRLSSRKVLDCKIFCTDVLGMINERLFFSPVPNPTSHRYVYKIVQAYSLAPVLFRVDPNDRMLT